MAPRGTGGPRKPTGRGKMLEKRDVDRDSVLQAIREFDALGRDAFLRKYGFRESKHTFLVMGGRLYDAKAILGAAYAHRQGSNEALSPKAFSGGAAVARRLRQLGFEMAIPTDASR